MVKKVLAIILVAFMAIIAVGCKSTDNSDMPIASVEPNSNIITNGTLSYEMRTDLVEYKTSEGMIVNRHIISFPYFLGTSQLEKNINAYFAQMIDTYRGKEIDAEAVYRDAVPVDLPYYEDVEATVEYNKNNYLSMVIVTTAWNGGEYVCSDEKAYTYNIETAQECAISEFMQGTDRQIKEVAKQHYIIHSDSVLDMEFTLCEEGICFYDNFGGEELPADEIIIPYTDKSKCIVSAAELLGNEKVEVFDGNLIRLVSGETIAVDLDANGKLEYVTFYEGSTSDGVYKKAVIAIAEDENLEAKEYTHSGKNDETDVDVYYIAKLDNNSDKKTVIATSCYEGSVWTNFSKYEKGILTEITSCEYGTFDSVNSDRTFNLTSTYNCLGTRTILKKYSLTGNTLTEIEEGVYYVDTEEVEKDLTAKQRVPAVFIKNGKETSGYIPAGTEIFIIKFEKDFSKAYFNASDGSMNGYIVLEHKENDYKTYIVGLEESAHFDGIQYSG